MKTLLLLLSPYCIFLSSDYGKWHQISYGTYTTLSMRLKSDWLKTIGNRSVMGLIVLLCCNINWCHPILIKTLLFTFMLYLLTNLLTYLLAYLTRYLHTNNLILTSPEGLFSCKVTCIFSFPSHVNHTALPLTEFWKGSLLIHYKHCLLCVHFSKVSY